MIDLQQFCSKDPSQQHPHPLSKPWSMDGKTYASDGRMIIRVDFRPDVTDELPENLAKSQTFKELRWHQPGEETTDFPQYEPPLVIQCRICKGTGKARVCPECDGVGEVEFRNSYHIYPCYCLSCRGDGLVPSSNDKDFCSNCFGVGSVQRDLDDGVEVGDVFLSKRLLEKIKNLPGVRLGPTVGVPNRTVPFVFSEGDGVLMCMEKDD